MFRLFSAGAFALFLLLSPVSSQSSETCRHDCTTDFRGFSLIRKFEGLRLFPYKDVVGIPTICFGHVIRPEDHLPVPMTGPGCQALLAHDIIPGDKAINAMVKVPLRQPQVDALSDFVFNLGTGTLKKSTLLKKINAGSPDASAEFMRYIYAGGKAFEPLMHRRHAEAALNDSY